MVRKKDIVEFREELLYPAYDITETHKSYSHEGMKND